MDFRVDFLGNRAKFWHKGVDIRCQNIVALCVGVDSVDGISDGIKIHLIIDIQIGDPPFFANFLPHFKIITDEEGLKKMGCFKDAHIPDGGGIAVLFYCGIDHHFQATCIGGQVKILGIEGIADHADRCLIPGIVTSAI